MIPKINVAVLFEAPSAARDLADAAIFAAATGPGFMTITGLPPEAAIDNATRQDLLRLFTLSVKDQRKLWRQKFAPENPNIYRGWFPAQDGAATYKEGIDMGGDVARGPAAVVPGDPLCEATPLPPEAILPGWRATVARYYRAQTLVAETLMRSIARGLGLPESYFAKAFHNGLSTLRLLHYPRRTPQSMQGIAEEELWVMHQGKRAPVVGRAHADSGLMTLLAQDGVPGLQALGPEGVWLDVPPEEGSLAINFGRLLRKWSGDRLKATTHRVIALSDEARFSVPFFYEPSADAEIAPLPGQRPFAPFLFGDYLWDSVTKFVEFFGMEAVRPPHGKWPPLT